MAFGKTGIRAAAILGSVLMLGVGGAMAQSDPPSKQSLEAPNACDPTAVAETPTPPAQESNDGTAPGSTGSTGWSGGTGGSFIGTTSAGAVAESKTWQPPTARGLDLAMVAPAQASAPASRC